MMVKWPARIAAGQISNDIIEMTDWLPTLLAAAGNPNIKEQLLAGHQAGDKRFNVHLDGYNFIPRFTGEVDEGPREEKFYFTDDGSLSALRYNDWKLMFSIQEAHGFDVWVQPYTTLRVPRLYNLRRDPFERADGEAYAYPEFLFRRLFLLTPGAAYVGEFLATFREYPPRQEPGTFTIDRVLESLYQSNSN